MGRFAAGLVQCRGVEVAVAGGCDPAVGCTCASLLLGLLYVLAVAG